MSAFRGSTLKRRQPCEQSTTSKEWRERVCRGVVLPLHQLLGRHTNGTCAEAPAHLFFYHTREQRQFSLRYAKIHTCSSSRSRNIPLLCNIQCKHQKLQCASNGRAGAKNLSCTGAPLGARRGCVVPTLLLQ